MKLTILVGDILYSVLNDLENNKVEVVRCYTNNLVSGSISGLITDNVAGESWYQVWNQVWDRIWSCFGDEIGEQVQGEMYDETCQK